MQSLPTNSLVIGSTSELEYYDDQGTLLIARNVRITPKHIEMLLRRNIFEVYFDEYAHKTEVEKILERQLRELDDLDLGETATTLAVPSETREPSVPPPSAAALSLRELRQVRTGNEGLQQLLKTGRAADLDRRIELSGFPPDRPTGVPLSELMTQVNVGERSVEYKERVSASYAQAIESVKAVLGGLAQGRSLDAAHIRGIVEKFLQTIVIDRNIVLGISGQKAPLNDDYLYHHTLNVCLVSLAIAASYGYNEKQVVEIGMAGLLHDVGMMLVPESIRNKGERLTGDEWFEVQKHPILGLHLLEKVNRLPEAVMIVAYQSHERENGSGYPRQRSGRLIHGYAKIVSLADIFEAVSSPRSYRTANAPYKGMEMLIKMARQGFVSADFVKAFLMYASLFPVGSIVGLSDGSIGKVISANGRAFTKPWVSVLVAPDGRRLTEREVYQLDLHNTPETQIVTSYPFDTFETVGVLEGF